MLKLIIGKAGSGKTSAVHQEICAAVRARQGSRLLIVPEQYSHEAERELCRVCGDTLSRYAEVLSFTGLARKAASALGGLAVSYLDEGGRTLCMAQTMKTVGSALSVFRNAASKPELQSRLLAAIDAMKLSRVTSEMLLEASQTCGDALGRKLTDLAVISEGYSAVLGASRADPSDTLSALAGLIDAGFLSEEHGIYVDGFTDFTGAELSVLRAILARGASLTVCLTLDDLNGHNEVFSLPRSSARKLLRFAEELGVPSEIVRIDGDASGHADPLRSYADHLFSYTDHVFPHEGRIELFRAENMQKECEAAAAKVLSLVREDHFRWRDIAVAVRGFSDYAAVLESTFEEYGIPLFTAGKNATAMRPLFVFLSCAFSIVLNGWKSDDVIRYLGTGLTGLTQDECDLLAGYVFLWDLKARDWNSHSPWQQPPDGYGSIRKEDDPERLKQINRLRERIAAPLLMLDARTAKAENASECVRALSAFLQEVKLPEHLEARSTHLRDAGRTTEADEMRQLWEILISAIEQTHSILGECAMRREEFARLFLIMLSRYDVGTIPAYLDAVTAGDFDRMRRRHIKVLLMLGAEDARLPAAGKQSGIFSEDELLLLRKTPAAFGEAPEAEMWREYLLIYNCLSLPSDRLILSFPARNEDGDETRPSLVMRTAERLFHLPIVPVSAGGSSLAAPRPAFRLAAAGEGPAGKAAARYFAGEKPQELDAVRSAAGQMRTPLSRASADALYGRHLKISASRAEKFFSCRYAYFCEFGLKARPFRKAVFSAPELGSFTHFVLQRTAEEVSAQGGFKAVSEEDVSVMARFAVGEYERDVLRGFAEKSDRFRYLFRRAANDVVRIAADMARELRSSSFFPLAFEFNFSESGRPLSISLAEGKDVLTVSGIADRIDGWEQDGKIYLRVYDYKTGSKEFSFSELWYGISLQLVLYLYALCADPEATRRALSLAPDAAIFPAGAAYVPAASRYVSVDAQSDEEEIAAKHASACRRSGIVNREDGLPDAWETGPEKRYSPFKVSKSGEAAGDALLSGHQFDLLYRHLDHLLADMARAIREGSIEANPYEKGTAGNRPCRYCFFREACSFEDGENGEAVRILPDMKPGEVFTALEEEENAHGSL